MSTSTMTGEPIKAQTIVLPWTMGGRRLGPRYGGLMVLTLARRESTPVK